MRRICLIIRKRVILTLAVLALPGCGLLDNDPSPPAPAVQAVKSDPPDAIRPGDSLRVTVAGEEELTGSFPVAADGTLHLELLGNVPAGGLTPAALAENLRQRLLGGYLKNPQVTVLRASPEAPRVAGALPPPPVLRKSETDQ